MKVSELREELDQADPEDIVMKKYYDSATREWIWLPLEEVMIPRVDWASPKEEDKDKVYIY